MTSKFITRHVLQAIEHLRARKARPDLHRICNQLRRLHNCSIPETTRCVSYLLDMGIVIKVEYKGSMSYRDASKWKRGHVAGHIVNSNNLIAKIQNAIDAIVARHAGAGQSFDGRTERPSEEGTKGATPDEIEEYFKSLSGDDTCLLSGDALFEVLTREVEMHTLEKSPIDATYKVGTRVKSGPRQNVPKISTPKVAPSEEERPVVQNNSSTNNPVATDELHKRQRPPSSRKRIKASRDEIYDFPPLKKARRQTQPQNTAAVPKETKVQEVSPKEIEAQSEVQNKPPASSKQEKNKTGSAESEFRLAAMFRTCNEIHQTETPSRHEGQEQEMLVCCGCQMKAHPACLCYTPQLLSKIDRQTWRCVTCKKCAICDVLLRTPSPMTCSGCDLAYHKSCHKPIMRRKPKDNWLCMKCTGKAVPCKITAPDHQEEEKHTLTTTMDPVLTKEDLSSADGQLQNEAKREDREEDSQDSIPPPSAQSEKNTAFPPTPRDSPSIEDNEKPSGLAIRMEPTGRDPDGVQRISKLDGLKYPKLVEWSVEEVYQFLSSFNDAVLRDSAEALRRQKIDGECLTLMTRDDILSRLSLSLGPALKLHRLIVNIRTDGHAHWFKDAE